MKTVVPMLQNSAKSIFWQIVFLIKFISKNLFQREGAHSWLYPNYIMGRGIIFFWKLCHYRTLLGISFLTKGRIDLRKWVFCIGADRQMDRQKDKQTDMATLLLNRPIQWIVKNNRKKERKNRKEAIHVLPLIRTLFHHRSM